MDIETLRKQIDAIDREIIERLNARVKLAGEIGRIKVESGQEIYVPSREEEVFSKLVSINQGPLDEAAIRAIYRQIISAAIALEKKLAVAYLGPEATYTHQAAQKNFGSSVNYVPLGCIQDVFLAVERGEADYGVIPVENSTEGAVFHSLDRLVNTDLKIVAQVCLNISHCLMSHSPLTEIKSVHSKDSALGQCRQWLSRKLPGVALVEAASTVVAVQLADSTPGVAAIAGKLASELYRVPVVEENIQDEAENVTRFFVIGKGASGGLGEGRDKSSYVFSLHNESGALMRALEPFTKREINLTRIESRPDRNQLWDYYFFIDLIGHHEDQLVQEALAELKKSCRMVKWLGSYSNAEG